MSKKSKKRYQDHHLIVRAIKRAVIMPYAYLSAFLRCITIRKTTLIMNNLTRREVFKLNIVYMRAKYLGLWYTEEEAFGKLKNEDN